MTWFQWWFQGAALGTRLPLSPISFTSMACSFMQKLWRAHHPARNLWSAAVKGDTVFTVLMFLAPPDDLLKALDPQLVKMSHFPTIDLKCCPWEWSRSVPLPWLRNYYLVFDQRICLHGNHGSRCYGNSSFNVVNLILFAGFGWRHQQSTLRHYHSGRGRHRYHRC